MINFVRKNSYSINDLLEIVDILRAPDGCPWDHEQTHESIRRGFLEESYEVCEAIDNADLPLLQEELGDVLLQIVFHASIEAERDGFTFNDVCDGICKKLIYRHPHVFSDTNVSNTDEVLENWDELKKKEKGQETVCASMNSVARSLPALWRAEKVAKKAMKVGFDWHDALGALDKLSEEIEELKEAIALGNGIEEELGDILFTAVCVSNLVKCDPEEALTKATDKFIGRFSAMEALAQKPLNELTDAEWDELWQHAKQGLSAT